MPLAIYILALATFVVGTQSYVFTGLLSELAADLGVTVGTAGQLVTAFAITNAVASPLMVNAFARYERRRVLVVSLLLVGAINLGTAFLPTFSAFLYTRIGLAVCASVVIPMAGAIAASLVPPDKQGQALGLILSGLTLALMLGVPLGTLVGSEWGWRLTFVFSGLLAFVVVPFVARWVPHARGAQSNAWSNFSVATVPVVRTSLALSAITFIASYLVFAYIGPLIEIIAGLSGTGIGALQSFIGFGSILGLIVGSRMADHSQFATSTCYLFGGFVPVQMLYSIWFWLPTTGTTWMSLPLGLSIFLSSAVLFALGPVIEKALVQAAPAQSALTLALNTSMIYLGQGIGAALGGAVITQYGYAVLGGLSATIAATALVIAILFRQSALVAKRSHSIS